MKKLEAGFLQPLIKQLLVLFYSLIISLTMHNYLPTGGRGGHVYRSLSRTLTVLVATFPKLS